MKSQALPGMAITLFTILALQMAFSGVISEIAENGVCRLSGPVHSLLCFVLTNPVIGFLSPAAPVTLFLEGAETRLGL